MNTFKPGDKVRCINRDYGAEELNLANVYTVKSTGLDTLILDEYRGSYFQLSRFELVQTQTNMKPFVFAHPQINSQPAHTLFRLVIYLPLDPKSVNISSRYYNSEKSLLNENLYETWGDRNATDTYRYRCSTNLYRTAQEALDAGEKMLREVFTPEVKTPASTEQIRYIDL